MRTNAQKLQDVRKAAAGRQTTRRAKMKRLGRPNSGATDAALVEAVSFLIARAAVSTLNADADADPKLFKHGLALPVTAIRDVAIEVLVDRKGYDPRMSRKAIGLRLAMRDDHVDPGYVPSLQPNPVKQAARRKEAKALAAA